MVVVFFVVGFEVAIAHLLARWPFAHELATPLMVFVVLRFLLVIHS